MAEMKWKHELDRRHHQVVLSGQHVAIHCHHYNINLQKTLEDTLGHAGTAIIYQAAEEAAFQGLEPLLEQYQGLKTIKSKLEMCSIWYQNCGLGIIHLQNLETGTGYAVSSDSHHVTGWLAKHGCRNTPGCHFTCGWLAGAMACVFGRPVGTYLVKEIKCKMMRDPDCIFQIGAH